MQHDLNVGVVLSTQHPPAWIADLIDRLDRHATIAPVVVVLCDTDSPPLHAQAHCSRSPLAQASQWFFKRFIDKPLFSATPWNKATLPPSVVPDVLSCHDTPSLQASLQGCDLLLNLTGATLLTEQINATGVPVWSVHEETLDARVEAALLNREPLLWIHLWADHGQYRPAECIASHALPRQSYSVTDLRRAAYCALPTLIESRLNWLTWGADLQLQETGIRQDLDPKVLAERNDIEHRAAQLTTRLYQPPPRTDWRSLTGVAALWWRQSLDRVTNKLFYEQWQLALNTDSTQSEGNISHLLGMPIAQYTTVDSPDRTWWADPHLLRHEQKTYVFFEEMGIDDSRGHLSVGTINADGQLMNVSRVLEQEKHLSYPFVFCHEDSIYMLPESAAERSVTLYQAESFPHHWRAVKTLLHDVDLADTTLQCIDGRWWMFTNSLSHSNVNERDELRLYHAEHLLGPWQPHPMNPVITGVDRARMAGKLIKNGNHWYRVSQYGSHRYGYGINFNRIDVLSTKAYQETPTGRLIPEPDTPWLGCHSMGTLDGVTVLDRVRRRRR